MTIRLISPFFKAFLVESGGVEPPSESPFTQTSPGAECCLKFPNQADSIQTALSGISLIQRRYGKSSRSRSPLVDALSEAAVLNGRTAA